MESEENIAKKRKMDASDPEGGSKSKKKKKKQKRKMAEKNEKPKGPGTVSVAVPGSILDNCQSGELRAYLAGQVARAAAVFRADEIVVFDDMCRLRQSDLSGEFRGVKSSSGEGCLTLARILQYLECPQYLRKTFFPHHRDLEFAGLLNPTDMPHHLRANEDSPYREGAVLDKAPPKKWGSVVNIGLAKNCLLEKSLQPGTRVTVKLDETPLKSGFLTGTPVSPDSPRVESGTYWGYRVRLACSLSAAITQTAFRGGNKGYDYVVGTSERGRDVAEVDLKEGFDHLLVVFGGLKGLEAAVEADEELEGSDPRQYFDEYVNVLPGQGSRTIRTEEAMLVAMTALWPKIRKAQGAV